MRQVTDVVRRNSVTITGNREGPVVVLAHGFGCDQHLWRLVIPLLEPDFTVVRFDHVAPGVPMRPPGTPSAIRGWRPTPRTSWTCAGAWISVRCFSSATR